MNLPVAAIRNHQLTWLVSAILVLLGLVSFFTMPRAEDPQLEFPITVITVINPGTSPDDMETLIVDPIEEAVNELDDLKDIKSNIEQGMTTVRVSFIYGADADEKFDDVQSAVNTIRDQLPEGIVKLAVEKVNPGDVPIMQLAMVSPIADFAQLRRVSERLERSIERVSGVKRVDIEAQPQMEVQIQVLPAKLHALGLGMEQVKNAVNAASLNIPGGHVQAGERRFSVLTSGDFDNLAEIENIVVSSNQGMPVYLRNVAKVSISEGLPSFRAFYQGESAVYLNVLQRPGTNIFDVSSAVRAQIQAFEQRLEQPLKLHMVNDQSIGVEKRVDGFFSNLMQGLVLVALATLLVLGRGASVVVVVAIPISIFIAIGWLDLSEFAIQQMSIVGLVIALGLLVDNAIVVTENVQRMSRNGMGAQQAAEQGSSQVGMAVVSGTLTTILSFVPMLLMQTESGNFIRSMPVTVVLALLASLLVALTLTPLMASKLLGQKELGRKELGKSEVKVTFVQKQFDKMAAGGYHRSLNWALRHPKTIMFAAIITFSATVSLFPYIGVSLFPKAEKPMVLVNVELPPGAGFAQTKQKALQVEKALQDYPLVDDIVVNVGRGNPRIYYNVTPNRQTPDFAQLLVKLKQGELSVVEPFLDEVRAELGKIPGVNIAIKEFNQGPPVEAPIAIRVLGESWQEIREGALMVENIVKAHPGTLNVDNAIGKDKIDIKLDINRDKAAMLGLTIEQIDQNIRAALVGLPMGTYKDAQGDEFTILLKSNVSDEPELQAFDTLKIQTPSGAMVPLKQVAKLRLTTAVPRLQHHSMERTARVTADVRSGYNTSKVTEQIIAKIDKLELPSDVRINIGGEQANRKESFGGMLKALIIAMLGIFAVLVMQFKSFKQPLIVFSAIPFAVSGAFVALFVTGYTFSFTAFVGLTSLVGIVVNNAIILIDNANQRMNNGQNLMEAIVASAQTRMTPIILTTLTTIGGLLPLTLSGSSMWAPMGWAIIGGLIISTVLTLFVVPVLYRLFTSERVKQSEVEADLQPVTA